MEPPRGGAGYESEKRILRTAGENRCLGGICINEAKPKVNVARNDLPRIVCMPCGVVCSRALLLFIGTPARRAMEINSMLHGAYSLSFSFYSSLSFPCRAALIAHSASVVISFIIISETM